MDKPTQQATETQKQEPSVTVAADPVTVDTPAAESADSDIIANVKKQVEAENKPKKPYKPNRRDRRHRAKNVTKADPSLDWPVYRELRAKLDNVRMSVDIEAGATKGVMEIIVVDLNYTEVKTYRIDDPTVKKLLTGLATVKGSQDVSGLQRLSKDMGIETYVVLGFIGNFQEFRQQITKEVKKRNEHRSKSEGSGGPQPRQGEDNRPPEAENVSGKDVSPKATS